MLASRFWTELGIVLTMAMVFLSACINYTFGYSLGTTEMNARIFACVSVVAVGVMAVLPLRISMHWEAGHKPRAMLGAGMFGILVAYAIAGSIGFGMQNRSELSGSRETRNAQLNDQVADRKRAVSQLTGLGGDQTAAAVSAKIDAAKKNRFWDQTVACTDATSLSSRKFCQGVDELRSQLDDAATAAVLREKIDKLNHSIEKPSPARRRADRRPAILRAWDHFRRRAGLGSGRPLYPPGARHRERVLLRPAGDRRRTSGARTAGEEITLPEWIGKWLTERAEPQAGAHVSLAELEADYRDWGCEREHHCLVPGCSGACCAGHAARWIWWLKAAQ